MSRSRYNWACPTCDAPAGEHCRTTFLAKHPGRVTDTHTARLGWVGIFPDATRSVGTTEPSQEDSNG